MIEFADDHDDLTFHPLPGTGWANWNGGDCPLPGPASIEVRLREGARVYVQEDGTDPALRWAHNGQPSDIIAYRIVRQAPPGDTTAMGAEQYPYQAEGTKDTNPKDAVGIRKAPMSTVSAVVLAEVGVAMLEGAAKYGRHNYRASGVRASVYYDGVMRHLMDWWEGTDTDPDSGMHHVTKAITSLVVLRDAMIQGMCTDDRPPRSKEFYTALNELAAQIVDRYADRNPRHYTIEDSRNPQRTQP